MIEYIELKGKQYPLAYTFRARKMIGLLLGRNRKPDEFQTDELAYGMLWAGAKAEKKELKLTHEDLLDMMDNDPVLEKKLETVCGKLFEKSLIERLQKMMDAGEISEEQKEETKKKKTLPKPKKTS